MTSSIWFDMLMFKDVDADMKPNVEQSELEMRLRSELDRITALTPAMLHSIDENGRLISVSDMWLAKLEYTREEVIGHYSSEFLTEASREYAIRDVLSAFFQSGRCDDIQYQMVAKSGRVIDVLLSGTLDRDPFSHARVSHAAMTDVSMLKRTKRRLLESEAKYRGLVDDQSELVSISNLDGELTYVNFSYAALFRKEPADMVGRNLFDFASPEAHAALKDHLKNVHASDHGVVHENQVVLQNGEKRWLQWSNRAMCDDAGQIVAVHSIGRDINERVVAERRLRESEIRYRLLADNSTDMVLQTDDELVCRYSSPACRELLGYEPEEMLGLTPHKVIHRDDVAVCLAQFQTLLSGEADRQLIIARLRHRNKTWIWVEAHFRAIKNPDTTLTDGVIGAVRDISARKIVEDELAEANRRLEALAGLDGLTGLVNRRGFDEALAKEHKRAKRDKTPLSLVMIDVDHFKAFNDLYGHPAGDECLRKVGRAISESINRPGDTGARYGGEEFSVLLPNTDEAGAERIAHRIRQAVLDLQISHDGNDNNLVSISAGTASYFLNTDDVKSVSLVIDADRALYRAKHNGRNTVVRATSQTELRASEIRGAETRESKTRESEARESETSA